MVAHAAGTFKDACSTAVAPGTVSFLLALEVHVERRGQGGAARESKSAKLVVLNMHVCNHEKQYFSTHQQLQTAHTHTHLIRPVPDERRRTHHDRLQALRPAVAQHASAQGDRRSGFPEPHLVCQNCPSALVPVAAAQSAEAPAAAAPAAAAAATKNRRTTGES